MNIEELMRQREYEKATPAMPALHAATQPAVPPMYPQTAMRGNRMGYPAYPGFPDYSEYTQTMSPHQGYPLYQHLPQNLTYPTAHTADPTNMAAGGPTRGRTGMMGVNNDYADGHIVEDNGLLPQSVAGLSIPDSQLVQEWPYGNSVQMEGRSTLTYSPQRTAQQGSML